jgi:phosphinothricin acetyltransferase
VIIRDAEDRDLDAILEIHNHEILTGTANWSGVAVDRADREAWLADHIARGFPVTVAIDGDGRVLGYGAYGSFRERSGYRFTVENSVYVRGDAQGRGVGRALLIDLIARARAADLHLMVALIEARNSASIALHSGLGFVSAGRLREVGFKFGDWLDLEFMQLALD